MKNGKTSTQLMRIFKFVFISFLFILPFSGMAQYDYEHYVPPFYCSSQVGKQELFLSTNSTKELKIFVEDGQGNTVAGPFTISRNQSKTYVFKTPSGASYSSHNTASYPDGCSYSYGIIGPKELNKPLDKRGLRIYSYDGPFFANIRHGFSNNGEGGGLTHGGSLSAKGAYAEGKDFYSGHLYDHTVVYNATDNYYRTDPLYYGGYPIRSHFISVMAVEEGQTIVQFSGIKCKYITKYEGGKVVLESIDPADIITGTLSKGQSYVVGVNLYGAEFHDESIKVLNGMNGTHITSTQKIVVNCGSWTAGAKPSQDIGFDQIVPVDQVRDKYIVMRGEGRAESYSYAYHAGQERTIVVATQDNTEVWVNGNDKGTLAKAGDFMILDDIVNPTAIPTLYIDTKGKDVYVYQTMCGTNQDWTNIGLNFIPPLTGLGIKEVVIPKANYITTGDAISPTVTVLAQKNVDVQRNGMSLSNPQNVYGTTEWVYYKVPYISGDCRFTGSKAINVAWTASSNTLGAAGYYSGFTKAVSPIHPTLNIDKELSLICESYDSEISVSINEPLPDFYEWYVNDEMDPFIKNGPLVVPAPDVKTTYTVLGYYRDPSLDILFNGDFSDGFNGFDSDYKKVDVNLVNPGDFALASSPVTENPILADYSAMDGGRMFLGYSDRQGEVVYQVNELPVEEKFSYIFKLYGRLADDKSSESQSLKILINDETIVENFKIDKSTEWQSVSALWKPETARKATIKILNQNLDSQDAFFALDSITFVQAVQEDAVFVARVIPNFSTVKDAEVHFCKGVENHLDVSNGDTSWYNYSWSKDGAELVDGALYRGVKSSKLIFKNPQDSQEGIYVCTIGFKEAYKDCATSDDTIDVNLTVFVDDVATVNIDTDKISFCSGATTLLNALVTGDAGDAGDVKWYVDGGTSPVSLENPYTFNYPAGTYTVRCEVENGCGLAFDEVVINVLSSPDLVSLTSNDNLCVGENIVLTAVATGDGTLTYNWKKGSETLAETGEVLTYPATFLDRESVFSVNVSSAYNIAGDDVVCANSLTLPVLNLDIFPLVEFDEVLTDATVCEGQNHSFNVTMKYPDNFYTYGWTKDGINLLYNVSSHNLSSVSPSDAGNYRVDVTNRCNSEFSAADLIVTPKIKVNNFNVSDEGPYCTATAVTATFDVDNTGAVYVYQVVEPDGTIKTVTNPYTFTIDASNQGNWEFLVSSSCDAPISYSKILNMHSDFGALTVDDIGTCIGEDVTFNANVSSIPPKSVLHYVWTDKLGGTIGTDSDQLEITNVQDVNLGIYTVEVTDQCGNRKTASANLTKEAVTSPATAAATTVCVGDNFSTTITYLGSPIFEWRFNDKDTGLIVGTTEILSLTNVSLAQAGVYYCNVTLICGTNVVIQRELKVNRHISVDTSTETVDVCEGEKPELNITVTGNPSDYTIAWTDPANNYFGTGSSIQLDSHDSTGTLTYYATVTGLCESFVKTYKVEVHAKPAITPVDPIVACEGDVTLTALVTGTDYSSIKWWKDSNPTSIGTGISHTITGATDSASEGTYIAKVITDYCGVVGTDVLLSIYEPIRITSTSDLNPTPCEEQPLSLVVNATGDGIEYKWYKTTTSGSILSTSNTLNLGVADVSDNNSYTCEVNSANGCAGKTAVFNVAIKKNVLITGQPTSVEICASVFPAEFTITATGDGILKYEWYDKNDKLIFTESGGNSSTLSIDDLAANVGQNYYCIVTGSSCRGKKSNKVSLEVKKEIVITDQPEGIKIADGGDAIFSVVASGDPIITYQWQESVDGIGVWTDIANGGVYSGVTSSTLIMTNVDKGTYDTNKYRCVVNNDCTPKNSDPALLELDANVKILIQAQDFDACEGDLGKSFTVKATAGSIYNWEYRKNSADVFENVATGGMTNGNATLKLSAITSAMASWEFRCTVSYGVTTPDVSNTVGVNVFTPVTFNSIADVTLCSGEGVHFEAKNIAGSEPYHYLWDHKGTVLGLNSQVNLSADDAKDGTYQVSVDNGVCPATTDKFDIDHYKDLALDSWGNISEICVGETSKEKLTVSLSDFDSRLKQNYSWTKDDGAEIGSLPVYEMSGLLLSETGLYKVEVSDKCSDQSISGFVNVRDIIKQLNFWDATAIKCAGTNLILEVKVSGYMPVYSWTYPDATRTISGNASKLKFNNLTSADAGTYTCTVTGICGDPVVYTMVLTVLEAPEITTGIDILSPVCEGDPLVLGPIAITGTHDDPIWTLSDNSTQTTGLSLDLSSAELSEAGNYKVTVRNICGSDVSLGNQVVNPTLILDPIEPQTVCEGNDVVFRAKATGTDIIYEWKVNNIVKGGNSSELVLDATDVSPGGLNTSKTYNVVCKITSTTGCGDATQSTTLTVKPNTVLHATLKNVPKYVGESHTMTVDVSGVNLVFEWTHELTDGTLVSLTETGATISLTDITMADAGYYTCKIVGECGQRLASGKLIVKEPVSIVSGLNALQKKCVGDPLSLSITATGQIKSIKWFKDKAEIVGETSLNLFISAVSIADAGVYKCEIEGEGISVITETTTVRVYTQTVLNSPLEDRSLCEGLPMDWIPDVDGTSDMTFQWTFNGVNESGQKILHYDALALSNEGNYEVQVTSFCGDVSTSANLEVIQLPVFVSTSTDKTVCENTPLIEFAVEYTGEQLKYQWRKDGADLFGQTSETLSLINIQLADEGDYNCKVYSTCGEEFSPLVSLNVTAQLQVLSDQVDMKVCTGEDVLFTADVVGNNVTYQWKVDGIDVVNVPGEITGANTPSLSIVSAQVAHSGYYACILSDECTDYRSTKPTELLVNPLPNTAIYGRMVLCAKEDRVTYVLNQVGADVYSWNVDGGIFAGPEEGARTRVTWEELSPGSLSVTIKDLETGCTSKVDSAVVLNQLPLVSLTSLGSRGVCEGEFELTGGNHSGDGIYWINGISQTVFNPSDRGAGTYAVYYSYTDENGCSNVTPITDLTVDVLPVVDITDDITVGSCNPTPLTAKTGENNIQWYKIQDTNRVLPDNLNDPTSMNPTFTPGESQVLMALVKDEHGCEGIDLLNLTVAPLPVVTTINDTTVGQCNQLVLQTDIVGDQDVISWTNPDHLDQSDIRSPKIIDAPEGTHTYAISVTDLYGCDASGEVTVTMVSDPTLGEDKLGCYGDKYEVDITGEENPVWDDRYTDPIRTIDTPGEYLLTVSNDYGCGDEQLFVINPEMKLGLKDTLVFEGQTVTFGPNLPSNYAPYFFEWQDGSIDHRFEVSETGNYKLRVEDNLGCIAIDSAFVEVKPVGIESSNAFLPLADDGINDVFYLGDGNIKMGSKADARFSIIEDFEMYVYNRWGELLYQTDEQGYNGGWNGEYKGKLCPAGAYVWIVFINGEMTNKGTVMLIR